MLDLKLLGNRIVSRDPERQAAAVHIRILRGLSRTDGVRPLSHEPLLGHGNGRDRTRQMNPKGERGTSPCKRIVQQAPRNRFAQHAF